VSDDLGARRLAALESLGIPGLREGLVVSEAKREYRVALGPDEVTATCAGKLLGRAEGRGDLPAVGDVVAVEVRPHPDGTSRATIHAVLPRKTKFSRRAAGLRDDEQIVAANVDTVFITVGLDADFNVRRIERYLAAVWESGATPVVLLTKSDLAADLDAKLAEARAVAGRAEVMAVSARTGDGVAAFRARLTPGETVAFTGSSGVGKSSLLNVLLGEETQRLQTTREHDSRGRHTTTHREMFTLPSGVRVIDTPGMRELQLWDTDEGIGAVFEDVVEIESRCRFGDCRHDREPGCAVRAALESGELDPARYESYRKLRAESERQQSRLERKRQERTLSRAQRKLR